MAGKADVEVHLTHRRSALADLFAEWSHATLDGEERAELIEQYCKDLRIGDVRRPTSTSVYMSAADVNPKRMHVLVLGRHDVLDLTAGKATIHEPGDIVGPGLASRLGPTVAFAEGFLAAQEVTQEPPVNVSILSLGESDEFAAIAPTLFLGHVDAVVMTASAAWDPSFPTITTGSRGVLIADLSLSAGPSASDYLTSGAIRNPLTAMTQLLSELRDDNGRITLPGFYDRAQSPDRALRGAWTNDGYDPNAWATDIGAPAPTTRLSSLERSSLWPGVSVLELTTDGDGATTPSTVSAKVAFYLVPDQRHAETEAALRQWFVDHAPPQLSPVLSIRQASRPYRCASDSPVVSAQVRAGYRLYGRTPVLVPAGGPPGSGEVAFGSGVPVAFAGIAPPSPTFGTTAESVTWDRFQSAVALSAETLLQLRRV